MHPARPAHGARRSIIGHGSWPRRSNESLRIRLLIELVRRMLQYFCDPRMLLHELSVPVCEPEAKDKRLLR